MIQLKFARVSRVAALIIFLSFLTPLVFAATTPASASLASAASLEFKFVGTPTAAPDTTTDGKVGWGDCSNPPSGQTGDAYCANLALTSGYVCVKNTAALTTFNPSLTCGAVDLNSGKYKYCNTGCAAVGKYAGRCLCLYDVQRATPGCTNPDTPALFLAQTTTKITDSGKMTTYGAGQCVHCGNILFWPISTEKVEQPAPQTQDFVLAGVKRVYVDADNLEPVSSLLTKDKPLLSCDPDKLLCKTGGFKVYIEFYDSGSWAVPSATDSTRLLPPLRLAVTEVEFEKGTNVITTGHDDNFNPGYPDKTIYSQGYGYYQVKQGTMVRIKALQQNEGPVVTDELWGWTVSGSTIIPQGLKSMTNQNAQGESVPLADNRKVSNAFMGLTSLCSNAKVSMSVSDAGLVLRDDTFTEGLNLYAPVYIVTDMTSDNSGQAYLKPVLVHSLNRVKLDADGNTVPDTAFSSADLCHPDPNDVKKRGVAVNGRLTADYILESYKEFPTGVLETGGKRVELTRTSDKDEGLANLYDNSAGTNAQVKLIGSTGFGAQFDWKRAKTYPTEFTSDLYVIKFNLYQVKSPAYCYLENAKTDDNKQMTLEAIAGMPDTDTTKKNKLGLLLKKNDDAKGTQGFVDCPTAPYLEPVQNPEQSLGINYYWQSGNKLIVLGNDKVLNCKGMACTEKEQGKGSAVPVKPVIVFKPIGGSFQPGVYALEATYPANQQAAPELATLSLNELQTAGEPSGLNEYLLKVGTTYHTQDYTIRIDDVSSGDEQRVLFRYRPASVAKTLDSLTEGEAGYEFSKYVPGKDYAVVGGIFKFRNDGDAVDAPAGPYASFAECTGNSPKYCTLIVDRGTRAPAATGATPVCTVTYSQSQARVKLPDTGQIAAVDKYPIEVCAEHADGVKTCAPSATVTNGEANVPSSALPQGSTGEVKTTASEKICTFATQSGAAASSCTAAFDAGNLVVTAQNPPLDLSKESVGVKVSLFAETEGAGVAELNFATEPDKIVVTKASMDAAGAWTSGEIDVQDGEGVPFNMLCEFQPPSAQAPCGAVIATTQCNELSVEGNQVSAQAGVKLEKVTGNTLQEVTVAVVQKLAEGGKAAALITTPSCPAAGQPTVVVTHSLEVAGEAVTGSTVQDSFTAPAAGSAVEPGSQVQGTDEAQTLAVPSAVKWFVRQLKGIYYVITNALQNKGPPPLEITLETNVQVQMPTTQTPEQQTGQQQTPGQETPEQQTGQQQTPEQQTPEQPAQPIQLTTQCSIATTSLATALDAAETQDPVAPTATPEISQDGQDVTVSGLQAAVKALADNGHGSGVKAYAYLSYQDENGGKYFGKDSQATAIADDGTATWIGAKPMKDAPYSILVAGHNGKKRPLQSYAAVKAAEGIGQSSTAPQELPAQTASLSSVSPDSSCRFTLKLVSSTQYPTYKLDARVDVKLTDRAATSIDQSLNWALIYRKSAGSEYTKIADWTQASSSISDLSPDVSGSLGAQWLTKQQFQFLREEQTASVLSTFKLRLTSAESEDDSVFSDVSCMFVDNLNNPQKTGDAELARVKQLFPALVNLQNRQFAWSPAYDQNSQTTLVQLFMDMPQIGEITRGPHVNFVDDSGAPLGTEGLGKTFTDEVITIKILKYDPQRPYLDFRTQLTTDFRKWAYKMPGNGAVNYGDNDFWQINLPVFCTELQNLVTGKKVEIILPRNQPVALTFDWLPQTYYSDKNDVNSIKSSMVQHKSFYFGTAGTPNLCAAATVQQASTS
ncbi:hypothetical protein AUJ16_02220 [Candidatus Micrarchaeota archaeon CG1_02_60_51]|nr:MAG: hypothetical protein AUJ16_02220 [Candidatus Micrarchaeota archaeon CG1_02_60_51]